jgi:hypothetical protein
MLHHPSSRVQSTRDHLNRLSAKRRNGVYRQCLGEETSRLRPPVLSDRPPISCPPLRSNELNRVNILLIALHPTQRCLHSATIPRRPRRKLPLGPRSWQWHNEKLLLELNRNEHEPSCKSETRSLVIESKAGRKSIWNMVEVTRLVCLLLALRQINLLLPCMDVSNHSNNTPLPARDWHQSAQIWVLLLQHLISRLNEPMLPCRPRHPLARSDRLIRVNLSRRRTSYLPKHYPSMIPAREARLEGGRTIMIIPRVIMLLCVIEVSCPSVLLIASELRICFRWLNGMLTSSPGPRRSRDVHPDPMIAAAEARRRPSANNLNRHRSPSRLMSGSNPSLESQLAQDFQRHAPFASSSATSLGRHGASHLSLHDSMPPVPPLPNYQGHIQGSAPPSPYGHPNAAAVANGAGLGRQVLPSIGQWDQDVNPMFRVVSSLKKAVQTIADQASHPLNKVGMELRFHLSLRWPRWPIIALRNPANLPVYKVSSTSIPLRILFTHVIDIQYSLFILVILLGSPNRLIDRALFTCRRMNGRHDAGTVLQIHILIHTTHTT